MALRESIPLQKIKIVKKSLGGIFASVVFMGAVYLYSTTVSIFVEKTSLLMGAFGIGTILCVGTLLFQSIYFKRYFYDINQGNIIIRKGFIAQTEITLPFSKITDVYVDQDILDVMFGLYDVHISTPTITSGLFAHIDGINKKGSEKMKHMILENISKNF